MRLRKLTRAEAVPVAAGVATAAGATLLAVSLIFPGAASAAAGYAGGVDDTPTSTATPTTTAPTTAAGTPVSAPATGGGAAPGADTPLAIGGVTMLLVGGGIVLSRWPVATSSLARKRRAAASLGGDAKDEQAD